LATLRRFVPPHADNEQAAACLRDCVGANSKIEWVIVGPDTLVDVDAPTDYDLVASSQRSALLNPGKTRRINGAHLMADLVFTENLWSRWQAKMSVIYNSDRITSAEPADPKSVSAK